jgi:hypothetical protein
VALLHRRSGGWQAKYPSCQCRVVPLDLAAAKLAETIEVLQKATADLDLALVVNNAGTGAVAFLFFFSPRSLLSPPLPFSLPPFSRLYPMGQRLLCFDPLARLGRLPAAP